MRIRHGATEARELTSTNRIVERSGRLGVSSSSTGATARQPFVWVCPTRSPECLPCGVSWSGLARMDVSLGEPKAGDIIVKKPDKHAGLLFTLPVGQSFSSVEGNTWTKDKDKEGVYIVRRLLTINYEFVRAST